MVDGLQDADVAFGDTLWIITFVAGITDIFG
jgi:hypothetical protein